MVDALALLDALPDAIVVVDAEARLIWANRTVEEVLGWPVEELAGQPVDFLCHPDDLPTALASLDSVRHKTLGTSIELRVRSASGGYRTFEVRGRDGTPEPGIGGVIIAMRDVSDRAGWEVAGGDHDLYRAVIDNAPGITMVLDGTGQIRGASRALTTILGRDLESTLGHHLRELVTETDMLTVEAELALTMSEAGQRTFEVAFTTRDGTASVPMSLTVVNLLDNETVEGLVVSPEAVCSSARSIATSTDSRRSTTTTATWSGTTCSRRSLTVW